MTSNDDGTRRSSPGTEHVEAKPIGSRYVLDYPIGQGACGRVWHGRRRDDAQPVAIKVLRAEYTADPDVVSRFLRERTMLEALNHPHLVSVADLVVEGDTLAVVMELVDGVDLRRAFKRKDLDVDDSLTLLTQVAHALAYIHDAGVLHRDIKPENIMVTRRDNQPYARLTDFGLAWMSDGQKLTRTSHVVGTPAYLAPELLAGRPYGPPVDIYALGVTAYEMLCGERPFKAEHPLALMRAHLDEQPVRPKGMAENHWRVVRACLAKSPDERPTAAELAEQFADLRSAMGTPRLGIDFGTCTTTAVLYWPDDRIEPLLFDGSPLLPSAVYASPDGAILTGRMALTAGRLQPQRCEPYPRLRVADGVVALGEGTVQTLDLVAAVLRRVTEEARQTAGRIPSRASIAHPSTWGASELALLERAAHAAGLSTPQLVAEPVAATAHFVGLPEADVSEGTYALLLDVGAATTTASVVRRGADGGFDLLATEVLPDTGGIDIDAAILDDLGEAFPAGDGQEWRRLGQPETVAERQASWRLWQDVRRAKETLSQATAATVDVPLIGGSVTLDRRRLERVAQPVVERVLRVARAALASAGVAASDVGMTLLVGGASRMPLVAQLLHQTLGHVPTQIEQPELVLAEGAAHLTPLSLTTRGTRDTAAGGPAPPAANPPDGSIEPLASPPSGWIDPAAPAGGPVHPKTGGGPRPRRRRAHTGTAERAGVGPPARRRALPRPGKLPATAATLLLATVATIVYSSLNEGSAGQAEPACGFKIAILGSSAGERDTRDAAVLAAERYNAANPGCTANLVEYDTGDPDSGGAKRAATRAQEIVADPGILGVVGPVYSREAVPALPVLDSAGLVTITPAVTDTPLNRRGWQVFHRAVGSDVDDAAAGTRLLTQVLKARRIFVVDDDSNAGFEASEEARRNLGLGALAGSASISYSGNDHSALINEIVTSGADALYYTGFADPFGPLIKQLRAARADITIVGWQWAYAASVIDAAGKAAADGVHLTCTCMPPERAGRDFPAQFTARFGRPPDFYAPEAFDAANILLAGLAAGRNTRADMLAWVDAYDADGVSGHLTFQANGDLATPTAWRYRIANGDFRAQAPIPDDPGQR